MSLMLSGVFLQRRLFDAKYLFKPGVLTATIPQQRYTPNITAYRWRTERSPNLIIRTSFAKTASLNYNCHCLIMHLRRFAVDLQVFYFEKGCRIKYTRQPRKVFWGHCFSKKFERVAGEALDVCSRVLKESNKSRFNSYSVRNSVLNISHITFRDWGGGEFGRVKLSLYRNLTDS